MRPTIVLLVLAACEPTTTSPEGGGDAGPPAAAQIDAYVRSLGRLPEIVPFVEEGVPSPAELEGDYSCTRRSFLEARQYDEIVAYATNSESLWPGALIAGDAVQTGRFTQLVLPRAPLSFSVSLENLGGGKSATMQSPALSAYRDALGGILDAEITGATAADIYAEIEEVHSRDQLSLALGADVDWLVGGVAASFDWGREEVKSRYLVKYAQAYYTVDVDQPESPSAFLAEGTTLEDVQEQIPVGSPPLYVSSITSGRMVLYAFESEYSSPELGAALEFVYHGGVDGSGNVSVSHEEVISRSKITAYILGGSGGDAAMAIDSYEALLEYLHQGGDYTRESPGAPIAYKLAHLADNTPARLSFTEAYEVETCVRVSQKVQVRLASIEVVSAGGDSGDDLELYGEIWAAGSDLATLFDRGDDDAVTIAEGQRWPDGGGGIAEAILDVAPQPGEEIVLGASLLDDDGVFPDDEIGYESVAAAFETGWRREVQLLLTGDDAQVVVTFELTPI